MIIVGCLERDDVRPGRFPLAADADDTPASIRKLAAATIENHMHRSLASRPPSAVTIKMNSRMDAFLQDNREGCEY